MSAEQIVYVIRESLEAITDVTSIVEKYHRVYEIDVATACTHDFMGAMMIMVDVPITGQSQVSLLKKVMNNPTLMDVPSIFVLSDMNRRELIQSKALGATDFVVRPISEEAFAKTMGKIANKRIEKSWSRLSKTQEAALKVSLKVFEDTYQNVRDGRPFSQEEMKEGCDLIIEATAEEGLARWMDAVKEHHNQTYRHSMMVCGYLVSFGLLLEVRGSDLQRLSICGLVHDIGKAYIPLDILDKPGKLNIEDWLVMREHPVHAKKIMTESECDPDVLDGVIHHHEYLDGSGYPDGLKGEEVSDFARLVTIADIFSSLVEKRSYKPAIPPEQAFAIMAGMKGKLDMDLLQAFKPIALETHELPIPVLERAG